jgi:hypothetical protein
MSVSESSKCASEEVSQQTSRIKEGSIYCIQIPKEKLGQRFARVSAALYQVDPSVHLNLQGKKNTSTLSSYVTWTLKASKQDLRKSLDRFLKRILMEKITIP